MFTFFLHIFLRNVLRFSCSWVGQVSLEELGHTEGTNLVLSEDGDHLGVGGEVLLVLGVLELLALDVGPESLDDLWPGQLLALLGSDEVGQLGAEVQRLGESGSLRHLDVVGVLTVFIL